jgi:hypothetical protein
MPDTKKELSNAETKLLSKLNVRVLKIAELYDHFDSHKIRIDKAYVDTLSDEKIDEIYKNYIGNE